MSALVASLYGGAGAETVSPLVSARELTLGANATSVAVGGTHERPYCAVALGDGAIVLIDIAKPAPSLPGLPSKLAAELRPLKKQLHEVAAVAVKPFGAGFVSAGQDGRVFFIEPDAGEADVWAASTMFDTGGAWIECVDVHPKTQRVAIGFGREAAVIGPGGEVLSRRELSSTVSGIAFDSTGGRIAASHYDGATVLGVSDEDDTTRLDWKGPHIAVRWSPDDRYLVTATQEKELHAWDLVTLQDYRMGGYPRKVRSLDWTCDPSIMCCSGADVVTAWSFAGAGPGRKPPLEIGFVFGGTVTQVAAHPARPYIAAGFSSGNVQVGAFRKGEAIVARTASASPVTGLAWSQAGDWLTCVDAAGTVSVIAVPESLGVN